MLKFFASRRTNTFNKAVLNAKVRRVERMARRSPWLVSARNTTQDTALHFVAISGSIEIAQLLIKSGADVNAAEGQAGFTPLHYAIMNLYVETNFDVARLLLEAGANVNASMHDGTTPLHRASRSGRKRKASSLLLEYGADVYARDEKGQTPLHTAIKDNYPPQADNLIAGVSVLLENEADINAQTATGDTPLHLAVVRQYVELVWYLLHHGADPNLRNARAMTPLALAREPRFFFHPPSGWLPFPQSEKEAASRSLMAHLIVQAGGEE